MDAASDSGKLCVDATGAGAIIVKVLLPRGSIEWKMKWGR
jgi:hypothetical protein